MKLQVTHRTEFTYAAPVIESFNETRLHPVSRDGQLCRSFVLKILPATHLSHYYDFYQNYVNYFELTESHTTLSIESTSTVTTVPAPLAAEAATVSMKRLPECCYREECYDFTQPSHFVPLE